MSVASRAFFMLAILLVAASAFGQINIVNFDFGAVPVSCSGGYAYQGPVQSCQYVYGPTQNFNATPGFGWILGSLIALSGPPNINTGAGITTPSGGFCPPSFTGLPFTQALVLQSLGSFAWQAVPGFTAGTYTLSFYLGGRCGYNPQRISALIDGNVIGTWNAPLGMPFTLETATFTVTSGGTHSVEFMGLNPPDSTAFVSYVVITPVTRPQP
jgi:hypothetical protein